MYRGLKIAMLAIFLLASAEMTASAQPEPTKLVEVFLKPGIDAKQFKTMGDNPSVSIDPTASWSIDSSDPFLKLRIREVLVNSMKRQGFVLVDSSDADLKLKVKVTQWGRLRSSQDLNLMEYLDLEAKVIAVVSGDLILKATGKYSRIDPLENTPDKLNEACGSIMDEILASLRGKPEKPSEAAKQGEAVKEDHRDIL